MDRATKQALIRWRLASALDDLETARIILQSGKYRGAVNRAYYTIFHLASAALTWHDAERSRHAGVQSAFGELLVKTGRIEPEFGRMYAEARRVREEQDYRPTIQALKKEEAETILADAERFVARLERSLREAGAIDEDTGKS